MNKNGQKKLLAAIAVFALAFGCLVIATDGYDAAEGTAPYEVASNPSEGQYADIAAAIEAAKTAGVTDIQIQLIDNVTGPGFITTSGLTVTIDLNGKTYTINKCVGSDGTKTSGMQLLQGSTVTISNGTLVTAEDALTNSVKNSASEDDWKATGAAMLIQSYCDELTIENVKLDGTKLWYNYILSANDGHVLIKGNTSFIGMSSELYAFDICSGWSDSYDGPVIEFDSTFTGTITSFEVAKYDAVDNAAVGELIINAGTISGAQFNSYGTGEGLPSLHVTLNGGTLKVNKGETFNAQITSGDNEIKMTHVKAGDNGLTFTVGSIEITGDIDAANVNSAIAGQGDIVFRDVNVVGDVTVDLSDATNVSFEGTVSIPNIDFGTDSQVNVDVVEGAVVDVPGLVESGVAAKYADGSVVKVNDLDYTIYNKILGTSKGKSVNFTIGIAIQNPEYDGKVVELRDLSPEVILLNATVPGEEADVNATSNARFDASLTGFEDGAPTNVNDPANPYKVVVAVEVNYNSSIYGNVSNYFFPLASFNIVPPEAEITLGMEGWNVNIGYNPDENIPEFTYDLKDEHFTHLTDNPFTVEFFLVTNGVETSQSDWGTLPAGSYTLKGVFSEWNGGNYIECIEYGEELVILTNSTVPSEMVFGPVGNDDVYYGKPAYRLQDDVVVNTDETTVTISGDVFFLSSYVGFWGESDDKSGYYVAFKTDAQRLNSKSTIVMGGANSKTIIGLDYDNYWVLYLGNDIEALTQSFTLTYDVDGDEALFTPTTYTIDVSGITPGEYVYKIILHDEKNATVEIDVSDMLFSISDDNDTTGDRFLLLPNNAGGADWITETEMSYYGGALVKITDDLDKNDDGKIMFTANYLNEDVEIEVLTVTFVSGDSTYSVSVVSGNPVAEPYAPAIEGKEFVGWFVNGVEYDFAQTVTENMTIIAQFVDEEIPEIEYSDDIVIGMYHQANRLVVSLTAVDGKTIPAGTISISGWYMQSIEHPILGIIYDSAEIPETVVDVDEGQTFVVLDSENYDWVSTTIELTATFQPVDAGEPATSNTLNFTFVAPTNRA